MSSVSTTSSPDLPETAPSPTVEGVHAARADTAPCPGLVQIAPRIAERAPEVFSGRKKIVIGRSAEAHLRLSDPTVSRLHTEVQLVAREGARVRDLGSRHGTFVNGARVEQEVLAPFGSIIRVGEQVFLLVADARPYELPPRRISGNVLGEKRDALAGPTLAKVWEQATRIGPLSHPALVLGESGSGKEAIARLIHAHGRPQGPFVAINVAAIPEGLFESELFGHAKGAFTGAAGARLGAFREASGGVLFLDEVADLQVDLQVKLLRAIDQMMVRPVGGSEDVRVDVRVVAATSQDVRALCDNGSFRLDLYYRLSGVVLHVPPLRERRDEILMLASAMLARQEPVFTLTAAAAEALALARFPGNVRELQHALTHATVQAALEDTHAIRVEHLPDLTLPETLERGVSPQAIRAAMQEAGGNATAAARALGISRSTLYNILRREGIVPRAAREG